MSAGEETETMAQAQLKEPFTGTAEEKAERLCTLLAEAIADADEAVFDADRVEPIETGARSGFWPWTSGGYHFCLPASLSYHWGSGGAPAPIQSLIDSGNEIIAEEWRRQNPDRPGLVECIHSEGEHTGIAQEWQQEAEEWESEAWANDDDCYFYKGRVIFLVPNDPSYRSEEAPEPGEPYIYVDAYLNTDLNYGRDYINWLSCYGSNPNQTAGEFKRCFTVPQFEALSEEEMGALVVEALKSLP
jgi:hypothetical protein